MNHHPRQPPSKEAVVFSEQERTPLLAALGLGVEKLFHRL